jgi:hypothetical protein
VAISAPSSSKVIGAIAIAGLVPAGVSAHLETRALLNADQIARYQQLRGYDASPAPEHRHHHG